MPRSDEQRILDIKKAIQVAFCVGNVRELMGNEAVEKILYLPQLIDMFNSEFPDLKVIPRALESVIVTIKSKNKEAQSPSEKTLLSAVEKHVYAPDYIVEDKTVRFCYL